MSQFVFETRQNFVKFFHSRSRLPWCQRELYTVPNSFPIHTESCMLHRYQQVKMNSSSYFVTNAWNSLLFIICIACSILICSFYLLFCTVQNLQMLWFLVQYSFNLVHGVQDNCTVHCELLAVHAVGTSISHLEINNLDCVWYEVKRFI